jgi:hypothetical protein
MYGACSTHEKDEKCMKVLVKRPEGKALIGRSRYRLDDNIKIEFRQIMRL